MSECNACGAPAVSDGGEGLVNGQVHWDIAQACAACGAQVIACGRSDVPGDLRERLLSEHGPTRLTLCGLSSSAVVLMKVVRAELGVDLIEAKAITQRIRRGAQTGTLTEMAFLAHRLRQAGIQATTERP
ncbi:hypothetical protein ABZ883_24500 [Streptomyces sp. NPDC046977]|uniref:hypothetical protein n=1 Tax=Streptomyces sp. NPDC046977 TaxID=3154703 RepID=UPI0033EF7E7C